MFVDLFINLVLSLRDLTGALTFGLFDETPVLIMNELHVRYPHSRHFGTT